MLPGTEAAACFSPPHPAGFLALAIADESLGTHGWAWFARSNGTASWAEATVPLGARRRPFQVGGHLQFLQDGTWDEGRGEAAAWGAWGCSCPERKEGRSRELQVNTLPPFLFS